MKLLTLAELEAVWPIKADTIAAHIRAGRLRAFDFSMCGRGPYGVRPEDAERFLEEYLLVTPAVTTEEPRRDQHRERRRASQSSQQRAASRLAAVRASHRI